METCPNGTNCESGTCNPVACAGNLPAYEGGGGGITVYWFSQGTLTDPNDPRQDVNCAYRATRDFSVNDANDTVNGGSTDRVPHIVDPVLFGAIATADYRDSAACGSCVEMEYNQRRVRITVADQCPIANGNPTCGPGHIDLSRMAFRELTGLNTGDFGNVSWRVVPCGLDEPVTFLLKEPNNAYYKAFTVAKHEYPIARAQFQRTDGTWSDATRDNGNFFESEADTGQITYRVRVFDVNGGIVEYEMQPGVAGPQQATHQFACN